MKKKMGYVYGYGIDLCWKIVDEYGSYKYWLGIPLFWGNKWHNDGLDYKFTKIKELGKARGFWKTLFTGCPYDKK